MKFKQYLQSKELLENNTLDALQTGLDVIGFEPVIGTAADATNSVISALRAGLSKERDERKKHLINAAISAVSMVPFADVIKLLKYRNLKKPALQAARGIKNYAQTQKASGQRFA